MATSRTSETVPTPLAEQGWGRVLRVAAARAVLSALAALMVWSVLPMVAGWTPSVVMSGSMEPRIVPGDVVLTRPVPSASLVVGQVVMARDPDHAGRTRTHRIVSRDGEGRLVLRGDANRQQDSSHVEADDILGLGVLRVPLVGRPMLWVTEGKWLQLGALLALLAWCVNAAGPHRGAPRGRFRGGADGQRRSGRLRRRQLAVVVTAGVVAASGSVPADAAFLNAATNAGNAMNAAADFHPYRTAVLADAPFLYWRLSASSGTVVADASPNARPGTVVNAGYVWGRTGPLVSEPTDKAISVTSNFINANASTAGPAVFSLEAWVRTTSTAGGRILGFGNQTGSTTSTTIDRQLYLAPTGKVYFGVGSSKVTVASLAAINDGSWHHVVATFTGGTKRMQLYVDGVLQGNTTATVLTLTGYWRAGGEAMSGWTGNPTGTYLAGDLDELAVYTTELSLASIQAHRNAAITP